MEARPPHGPAHKGGSSGAGKDRRRNPAAVGSRRCGLRITSSGRVYHMADEQKELPPGIYLVATPIGNLEDISFRQKRILLECDLVACEDTRRTGSLLSRLGIKKPLLSYHEHNEAARARELAARAAAGERIAVVSDAGTPGISDPAYRVVCEAVGEKRSGGAGARTLPPSWPLL